MLPHCFIQEALWLAGLPPQGKEVCVVIDIQTFYALDVPFAEGGSCRVYR